ncbi:MAG: VOC family protein [Devosiaceae bacterium]|nr:VOC family protein [Devosiaceae bacterium MH13]
MTQTASHPEHRLVWAEIPVNDLDAARQFYGAVLGSDLEVNHNGPNPMVDLPIADMGKGISAHLYPGKPAPQGIGPTVHLLASESLETTADRVVEAGGKVLSPPIDIPVGSFIYTQDPDGNSIGWFTFKDR